MISKSLSTSERYASLTTVADRRLAEFCQALYPLLVSHADDFGRQQGDVFTVKHAVHPSSPRKLEDFTAALTALHGVQLITWYEVETRRYIQIVNFEAHQWGLSKRTESRFPEPPRNTKTSLEIPGNPGQLNRTELKRTELNRKNVRTDRFERFWQVYPCKVGKDAARRAFERLAHDNDLTDAMIAAVERHQASPQWQKDGGQFIPHPRTWLHQGRWKDEGVTRSAPEASVDLKRLLWRALRPEDGRVWLEHATVAREGSRVRLCTVAPAKLQPAHAALQAALRAQAGADLSLEIVGVGGDA